MPPRRPARPRPRHTTTATVTPTPTPTPSPTPSENEENQPPRPWASRRGLGKWDRAAIAYHLAAEEAGTPLIVWTGTRWRYRRSNFRASAIAATSDEDIDDCLFLLHMGTLAKLHSLPVLDWMPPHPLRAALRIRVRGTKAETACTACLRAGHKAGSADHHRQLRSGRSTTSGEFRTGCYYLPGAGGRCSGCAHRQAVSASCTHAFTPYNATLATTLAADVAHLRRVWEDLREEIEEACDNIDAMQEEWNGASAAVDRLEKYRDRMEEAVGRIGGVFPSGRFQDMGE